jgi:hypothetical protein
VYKGEKKIMDFNTSYVRGKGVEFCVERGAGAMRGSYITKVKSLVKKAKELEAYKNKKDLDSKIYAFSCNLAEKVMMPVVARLCDRLNAAKIANGRLAQSTYSSTDYEYISIEENGAKFLTLHMNKHTPLRMGVESSTPAKIMEIAAAVKMYEADLLAARKTIISQVAEYRKGLETAV